MARLPGLIAALAKTDGRDDKALTWLARVARERGLITTTKRGLGAAEMTARDAANLLIAAIVAEAPAEVLARTEMVRGFVPEYLPPAAIRDEPGVLGEISRAATFGDALAAAIEGASELLVLIATHVEKRFADEPNAGLREHALGMNFVGFDIEFESRGGAPTAVKMALWERAGLQRHEHYVWRFMGNAALLESGYYMQQAGFDRRGSTTIGIKTLLHLSLAVLGPDELPEYPPEQQAAIRAALEGGAE